MQIFTTSRVGTAMDGDHSTSTNRHNRSPSSLLPLPPLRVVPLEGLLLSREGQGSTPHGQKDSPRRGSPPEPPTWNSARPGGRIQEGAPWRYPALPRRWARSSRRAPSTRAPTAVQCGWGIEALLCRGWGRTLVVVQRKNGTLCHVCHPRQHQNPQTAAGEHNQQPHLEQMHCWCVRRVQVRIQNGRLPSQNLHQENVDSDRH